MKRLQRKTLISITARYLKNGASVLCISSIYPEKSVPNEKEESLITRCKPSSIPTTSDSTKSVIGDCLSEAP
ncbi:hypothetical protein [Caldisericum sp. AR60]|uniref:hypothetical protein n=1 Tax=Caldisericum sp. AR60 TaxID=3397852 RepID=UPI0039FD25B3